MFAYAALAVILLSQAGAGPAFYAASIKPTSQAGQDVEGLGNVEVLPGGRLVAENARLDYIIRQAYGMKDYQVSGGPAWIHSAHYSIEAKAEGNPDSAQTLLITRKLLEDRFQLKVHRETKQLSVYLLDPAPGGIQVRAVSGGNCSAIGANAAPAPPGSNFCGRVIVGGDTSGGMQLRSENAPVSKLINTLSNLLGRGVIDETGLTGEFTFQVKFVVDDRLAGMPHGAPAVDKPAANNDLTGRSLFDALQEQLGLSLKPGKGPVETLVIDHVEKPGKN